MKQSSGYTISIAKPGKAEDAIFVASEKQPTPMGFGIVAFGDRDRAEEWAAEHVGELHSFSELTEKYE